MKLGRYEIQNYFVVVNNKTESRQRIIYIGNNNEDYFIERYYGNIRDGYSQSNSLLRNLNYTDIKSHIPGESIVIFDKSLIPMPLIYISISSIQSIERDGDSKLIIVDSQLNPTSLEFLTKFDCDQAHSLIIYLLDNPSVDISNINADLEPPVIYFNDDFNGHRIILDKNQSKVNLSSLDGDLFRVDIELSKYNGTIPINKADIINGLIKKIIDNRDGYLSLIEEDVIIYKDVISVDKMVDTIDNLGFYIVKFNLIDLGRNENNTTIIIYLK